MENKNIKSEAISEHIEEEQLAEVAGGQRDYTPLCHFTLGLSSKDKWEDDGSYWIKCASIICTGCSCRYQPHCKDKWHLVSGKTKELLPSGYSNHHLKSPSNNFNT